MVTRKGLGKGRGKGFKNLLPTDKKVHGDSARGIRQPQKISTRIKRKIDQLSRPDKLPFSKSGIKTFHLPLETEIYVPSTTEKSKIISDEEFANRIRETQKYFSKLFGGFSKVNIEGGFVTSEGKVVKERIAKVTVYSTTDSMKANENKVKEWLVKKQKDWKQESIGYGVEGDLYYIEGDE
jgi:hypothetical protein